jgi:hypothetical protein
MRASAPSNSPANIRLSASLDEATATVEDVLGSIGDTCPECPPDAG